MKSLDTPMNRIIALVLGVLTLVTAIVGLAKTNKELSMFGLLETERDKKLTELRDSLHDMQGWQDGFIYDIYDYFEWDNAAETSVKPAYPVEIQGWRDVIEERKLEWNDAMATFLAFDQLVSDLGDNLPKDLEYDWHRLDNVIHNHNEGYFAQWERDLTGWEQRAAQEAASQTK